MANQGSLRPTADAAYTLNTGRVFIQFCGPLPNAPTLFGGIDTQFLAVEGVSKPIRGGITPLRVPDPLRPRQFRSIARSLEPADLPTYTLRATEGIDQIPFQWGDMTLPFNVYVVRGQCVDLDDMNAAGLWEVFAGGLATDQDFGSRTPVWEDDDLLDDSTEVTATSIYKLGSISFQARASDMTNTEVIDGTYGKTRGCSDCGIYDPTGKNRFYAVTRPGLSSPGLLAEVIYSPNVAAGDWRQVSIDGMPASEVPIAIDIVGSYLIVLGATGYYYAAINGRTGTIGTFTRVTLGFEAAYTPTDMLVMSSREIFFPALSGRMYKSTDITAGVTKVMDGDVTTQHLRRARGRDDTIVIVGDSGAIIWSNNRGNSFGASPAVPTSWGLRAVDCLDNYRWWVGSGTGEGKLYYTLDGGYTWFNRALVGSTEVNDIYFANDEVGFVAYNTGSAGRLFTTVNGGYSWMVNTSDVQRRLLNIPTHTKANRIALPYGDPAIGCNNATLLAVAPGNDGLIIMGTDNIR